MRRFVAFTLAVLLGLAVTADEDQVEYRQEVMSAIGGTMGALAKILRQEVDRPNDIAPLAAALAELAETAQSVFPEGSEGGDALPEIWEEPQDFAERLTTLKEAASAFREAASSGDMAQIGPAVGELGQACRGCHTRYRE
ncbi:MAG: cytochrome c [Gammaproteobacteria bacterium]|nr:cytochrome c [Gammaproteobacteria bacterium]